MKPHMKKAIRLFFCFISLLTIMFFRFSFISQKVHAKPSLSGPCYTTIDGEVSCPTQGGSSNVSGGGSSGTTDHDGEFKQSLPSADENDKEEDSMKKSDTNKQSEDNNEKELNKRTIILIAAVVGLSVLLIVLVVSNKKKA